MNREPSSYVALGGEFALSNRGQLELLRTIMERGVPLRTTVLGFSMTPSIRDEDVVTIVPMADRKPRVGDVVAGVLPGTETLRVHRLVKETAEGWLLRGDNCRDSDGVVGVDDILGRVVRVQRDGREVSLATGVQAPWVAWFCRHGLLARRRLLCHTLRRAASRALQQAQRSALYRTIGRRLAQNIRILEAGEVDPGLVRRCLRSAGARPRQQGSTDRSVVEWVAEVRGSVVGFVQLVEGDDSSEVRAGCWLFSLVVRVPYRGLGIGQALTMHVVEQARSRGADALSLVVADGNTAAITLYTKLGFEQIGIEAPEPGSECELFRGRRRVVMQRVLG